MIAFGEFGDGHFRPPPASDLTNNASALWTLEGIRLTRVEARTEVTCDDLWKLTRLDALRSYFSAFFQKSQKNFQVNIRDKHRRTPLHYAALKGHNVVANLLLEFGADLNAVDVEEKWKSSFEYINYTS